MSDIVDLLRDHGRVMDTYPDVPMRSSSMAGLRHSLDVAALEIERLRETLAATERDLARTLAALDHHLAADR